MALAKPQMKGLFHKAVRQWFMVTTAGLTVTGFAFWFGYNKRQINQYNDYLKTRSSEQDAIDLERMRNLRVLTSYPPKGEKFSKEW